MTRTRMMHARLHLSLFVTLVLTACGQGPSVQLTLDAASVEVVRGGDVEVLVTLTRAGGAAAEMTLSASGLPANVTASFSPATLVGTTLTSTLTLSATAAATESSYDVTVAGAGPGLSASADLDVDVISLSVTGRVFAAYGYPLAGASVRSQGDSAITDADGTFTLTGLTVPYDLSVWNTVAKWAHVYEGLTSPSLELSPIAQMPTSVSGHSADISGTLNGDAIPVGTDQQVLICAEGVDGIAQGCATVATGSDSYSFTANWFDDASRKVVLYALQIERDGSVPVGYPGYTSAPLTLTDGIAVTVDLDLGEEVATETVEVSVETDTTISGVMATLQLGPGLAVRLGSRTSGSLSQEFVVPVIAGTSYSFVSSNALQEVGWQTGVTGTTATVRMPGGITLTSPVNAATNVTQATTFSSATAPGAPTTFQWTLGSTDSMQVAVTSMDSSHTIPSLASFGLTLPANTASTWQAVRHAGTSVDDATNLMETQSNLILLLFGGASPGLPGDGGMTFSGSREFTTAP